MASFLLQALVDAFVGCARICPTVADVCRFMLGTLAQFWIILDQSTGTTADSNRGSVEGLGGGVHETHSNTLMFEGLMPLRWMPVDL